MDDEYNFKNYGVDDEEASLLTREEKRERELVSFRWSRREFQRFQRRKG